MFLVGSALALALGPFTASPAAPWVSMAYSLAAVVLTLLAVLLRRR